MHGDDKKTFREIVRVLRKQPASPKYKRVSRKEKDKKKANKYNKHYIKFQCGTHGLIIYDKTYRMTEQGLQVAYEDLSEGAAIRSTVSALCIAWVGKEAQHG